MPNEVMPELDPSELARCRSEGAVLLDVRTPAEFAGGHLPGSWNVPTSDLNGALDAVKQRAAAAGSVVLVCRTGRRARDAQQFLQGHGLTNVAVLRGGIEACPNERLAATGKAVMSLERQVRIAAGSLVVLSVALGYLVHPGAYALAAFVGAGLVFAGITDTCGMGLLLARMPWNR